MKAGNKITVKWDVSSCRACKADHICEYSTTTFTRCMYSINVDLTFYLKLHIHCITFSIVLSYYIDVYTEYGKKEIEGAYVYNEKAEVKGEVTIKVIYIIICTYIIWIHYMHMYIQ